ncbi:MAG: RNA methyltransferase [Deltaproteobacteria bacterium]|nr:RNA methyltransferase [Deltaproteobacteria bacterium]
MLVLPVAAATTIVLVRPHYPENVGAAARAMKTMGLERLVLVRPGRLAVPEHEMALKMAVKSRDVLAAAREVATVEEALAGATLAVATTSRRGVPYVLSPRSLALRAVDEARRGGRIAVVFGNEKTGLAEKDLARCGARLRIPMADDQPSINLAQAVQIVAYELFVAGLCARGEGEAAVESPTPSEAR